MRTSRFSEQQIVDCVSRLRKGETPEDLAQEFTVSVRTVYRWRQRFDPDDEDGFDSKQRLQREVNELRQRCVLLEHDVEALTQALVGRYDSLDDRRRIIQGFMRDQGMSERHACDLARVPRSSKRYADRLA